jgi:asparagine synthase (glutamine-hydrolysing)
MFTERTFFDNLEPATWHLDQPLNHPNSLGIYLLAKKSRELVTVLLSGEGADELFGGYTRYYYARLRPKVLASLGLLRHLPRVGRALANHFGAEAADATDAFIASSLFQRPGELRQCRPEADFVRVVERRRDLFPRGGSEHVRNCLKYDMQTYLVDLLVRQDKMTMAHSLENRVPFLDRKLVAFVRSLPTDHLVGSTLSLRDSRMRNTKVILKRLAGRVFDEGFVYRRKGGFRLPLAQYYARPEFRELMEGRLLPGMRARGVVREDVVRRWWRGAAAGQVPDEMVWIYIAFELWAQRFLDRAPVGALGAQLAALT